MNHTKKLEATNMIPNMKEGKCRFAMLELSSKPLYNFRTLFGTIISIEESIQL